MRANREAVYRIGSRALVLILLCACGAPVGTGQPSGTCSFTSDVLTDGRGKPVVLSWRQVEPLVATRKAPQFLARVEPRGIVEATVEVAPDGTVRCVNFERVHPLLKEPVRSALYGWTFRNPVFREQPVAFVGKVHLDFP